MKKKKKKISAVSVEQDYCCSDGGCTHEVKYDLLLYLLAVLHYY